MYSSSYTNRGLNTREPLQSGITRYILSDGEGRILCSDNYPFTPSALGESFEHNGLLKVSKPILIGSTQSYTWWSCLILSDSQIPDSLQLVHLRNLSLSLPPDMLGICGRATQLSRFDETTTFCGKCGANNRCKSDEIAKICPFCGLITFPRLSPAIIVRITNGDRILLARSPQFPTGLYSVIAGFIEPGESLEEAVSREVFEEVGLMISDIRYFGSQPWPFPDSLMIGFVAKYVSGSIVCDPVEIESAAWFTRDAMPDLPGHLSISRALIDDYLRASE